MSTSSEPNQRYVDRFPFDPMFTGDELPDHMVDVSGATIVHIALDSTLRISMSSGWRICFEGDAHVAPLAGNAKELEFIHGVDPDDANLTPELRALIGQRVTALRFSAEEGHLAIDTPEGTLAVDARFAMTPWEMWGPDGEFIER